MKSRFKGYCRVCNAPARKWQFLCVDCWLLLPADSQKRLHEVFIPHYRWETRNKTQTIYNPYWTAWAKVALELVEMLNPEAEIAGMLREDIKLVEEYLNEDGKTQ